MERQGQPALDRGPSKQVDDLRAVLRWVADRTQQNVLLFGISIGATISLLAADEAARRIREQQGQQPRPLLIALTEWGQDEDRRRSEEAGFDAHIVKTRR